MEVCIDGVWGAVCDDELGETDAHVACQQLGHPELGIYENSTVIFINELCYHQSPFHFTTHTLGMEFIQLYSQKCNVVVGKTV